MPSVAVYAVHAISDGLRQKTNCLRVTCVYPGVVESELANTITDKETADAINQPDDIDSSDIGVRPTASQ